MTQWENKLIKVSIEATTYGFMAITHDLGDDGAYKLTHTKSGYCISPEMFDVNNLCIDGCKSAIEVIVDNMPEADALFSKIEDGTISKDEKLDLKNKLTKLLNN